MLANYFRRIILHNSRTLAAPKMVNITAIAEKNTLAEKTLQEVQHEVSKIKSITTLLSC